MPNIPNPQSELLREPNLLIPGKKPVGAVKIDPAHFMSTPFSTVWLFNGEAIQSSLTNKHDFIKAGSGVTLSNLGINRATEYNSGSSAYHEVASHTDFDTRNYRISMGVIARFTATPYREPIFIRASAYQREYGIASGSGNQLFAAVNDGVGTNVASSFLPGTDKFTAVFTGDNSTLRLYANGVEVGNTARTREFITSGKIRLGEHVDPGGYWEDADIEIESAWLLSGTTLTAGQIADLYADPYQFLIPA